MFIVMAFKLPIRQLFERVYSFSMNFVFSSIFCSLELETLSLNIKSAGLR